MLCFALWGRFSGDQQLCWTCDVWEVSRCGHVESAVECTSLVPQGETGAENVTLGVTGKEIVFKVKGLDEI